MMTANAISSNARPGWRRRERMACSPVSGADRSRAYFTRITSCQQSLNPCSALAPPSQDAPGKHASVVAAVHDHLAVDQHGGDADRVLVRVIVGRAVGDAGGIEDRDVRPGAFAQHTAVAEAEGRGRRARRLVDGGGKAQEPVLADER